MIIEAEMTEECRIYEMMIPLSLVRTGEETVIHAFPWAMGLAERLDALAKSHPDLLFTDFFYTMVSEYLRPLAEERGYEPDEGYCLQCTKVYRMERPDHLNRAAILPETKQIHWNDGFSCRTETVLDENYAGCLLYGVVKNGTLLSFANVNHDDGEVADIGVETAPEEEGKGYASSNVAALTASLLAQKRHVTYICLEDNPASAHIAEKAGFTLHALEYNYVCFLKKSNNA